MKPIAYDLFCGLGGWAEGLLAEGYDVTGFDIEAHDYGTGGYPGKLILRDIRSIHGSELKDAAVYRRFPTLPGIQLSSDALEARQGPAASRQHAV